MDDQSQFIKSIIIIEFSDPVTFKISEQITIVCERALYIGFNKKRCKHCLQVNNYVSSYLVYINDPDGDLDAFLPPVA